MKTFSIGELPGQHNRSFSAEARGSGRTPAHTGAAIDL